MNINYNIYIMMYDIVLLVATESEYETESECSHCSLVDVVDN